MARDRSAPERGRDTDKAQLNDGDGSLLDRRSYLGLSGAAVAAVAGAGVTSAAEPVDIVEAGADPTGETPVDPVLDDIVDDDTRVVFPPGTYRLEGGTYSDLDGLELVAPEGATIVPPRQVGQEWLSLRRVSNLRFEGFTVDCTARDTAPQQTIHVVGGDNVVRDVTHEGVRDGSAFAFLAIVEGETTTLTFDSVRLPDGGAGGGAYYCLPPRSFHDPGRAAGTLRFVDCVVEGFGQGLYATDHAGPLEVFGGEFADCGIAQIRAGGGHEYALLRDVAVRVEGQTPGGQASVAGLRFEEGENALVDGCDVAVSGREAAEVDGAVVVGERHGDLAVRDTDVRTDGPAPGIVAAAPAEAFDAQTMPALDELPSDWAVDLTDVRVAGDAADATAVEVVERDGCTLTRLDVETPGADGVRFVRSADCTLSRSRVETGGDAVDFDVASGETRDVTGRAPAAGSLDADGASGGATARDGDDATELPHTVTVTGSGADVTTYEITVDGALEGGFDRGGTVDTTENIFGTSTEGAVTDGVDAYAFAGRIVDVRLDGPATLAVDGRELTADDRRTLGLPNALVVGGDGGTTRYTFDATGEVARDPVTGRPDGDRATRDDGSVTGEVSGEADAYRFSGAVASLDAEGSATIQFRDPGN